MSAAARSVGLAELSARTERGRGHLLPPSVGSVARPFEVQLARLSAFVRREGSPDCVFVGSSLVLTGVDPEVFDAAYEHRAGRHLRCFNLGVPGMSASDVGAIAGILLEDYEPSLIVYGATFRDFGPRVPGPGLEALAWVRYRNGWWSADGWLIDHSDAYRYYLTYRDWMDREQRRLMSRPFPTADNGFWRHAPRTAPVTLEQQLEHVKDDLSTLMRETHRRNASRRARCVPSMRLATDARDESPVVVTSTEPRGECRRPRHLDHDRAKILGEPKDSAAEDHT